MYLSLARKYRPQTFADLVGQETTAQVLANAILLGRAPNGVIFSGVRGIGKTTIARLYAKALNCPNRSENADPCGQCASCQAIANDTHEDVFEIDGASHNGVDEVRSLQETITYAPQRSRYKVYIIDEVHMLSTSAFNALLKTLEEPPEHVVFVMATTELEKVPDTVIGRCQTFHLRKISLADMERRIRSVLEAEKIDYDPPAVGHVCDQGQGSMRDALTFLEQAVALGRGKLSLDAIQEGFGCLKESTIVELLKALIQRQARRCMELIGEVDDAGLEMDELTTALAQMARNGFVVGELGRSDDPNVRLLDLEESTFDALHALAKECQPLDFNRLFRTLVQCRKDQDGSGMDRFILENYCFEWCFDPGLPSLEELQELLSTGSAPSNASSQPAAPPLSSHRSASGSGGREESPKPAEKKPRSSLTKAFAASLREQAGESQKLTEKKKPRL